MNRKQVVPVTVAKSPSAANLGEPNVGLDAAFSSIIYVDSVRKYFSILGRRRKVKYNGDILLFSYFNHAFSGGVT